MPVIPHADVAKVVDHVSVGARQCAVAGDVGHHQSGKRVDGEQFVAGADVGHHITKMKFIRGRIQDSTVRPLGDTIGQRSSVDKRQVLTFDVVLGNSEQRNNRFLAQERRAEDSGNLILTGDCDEISLTLK